MNLFITPKDSKLRKFIRCIALSLCVCLLSEQSGFAQASSPADISKHFPAMRRVPEAENFRPLHLRYLSYDCKSSDFKILMDKGSSLACGGILPLESTTRTLFDYFLIGITLPDESFWVNLRPDAPSNIIDPLLAQTDIGKVFLEADLQLKKDTAQFINPGTKTGREYWGKLYKKAEELFGSGDLKIPTATRPWIVPGEIVLGESQGNAYIYKATLKVMLEADYLGGGRAGGLEDQRFKELNEYAAELSRSLVIPRLTREVNTAKRYAQLRQVYYSLILAQWFKHKFYGKGGYYSWLINRKELSGLTSSRSWSAGEYFDAYRKSFANGEFNIQERVYSVYGQSLRSYLSGGISFPSLFSPGSSANIKIIENYRLPQESFLPDYAVLAEVNTRDMQRQIRISGPVNSQEIRLIQHSQEAKSEDPGESVTQIEIKKESVSAAASSMHDLKVGRASLREEMYNLERASGFPQAAAYQSSSPLVIPVLLVACGISVALGYLLASAKINKIRELVAKKDAQIDLLGKQIKSLSNEIRLLREEMPRYASFGIPSGNRPAQNDNTIYQEDKNGRQDNVESAPWMGSFRAAYAQWLYLNPKATTREKVSKVFSLCENELLKSAGSQLDLDEVDAQFIKGLVEFVVRSVSGDGKGKPAGKEEIALIRLEVESKIERLLSDKVSLSRKIRRAIQDFSLRAALETTVLEGVQDSGGGLSLFLDEKTIEYHNVFIGFTVNKLEIAWSKYKQLDDDVYLRTLYGKEDDYRQSFYGIENSVYSRIIEEFPGLKDQIVRHKQGFALLRSKVAMAVMMTVLTANTFTTPLSAAPSIPNQGRNIVQVISPEAGIAADTVKATSLAPRLARVKAVSDNPEQQILIPVGRQVAQDTLKDGGTEEYYEIIKIGETGNTDKIRYLRRVLRQYDDSKWEGLNPGAILKYVSPISGSSKPGFNAELTIGGIFDFLKSGVVHLLALGNEQEPSRRVAAAWSLGKLSQAVESQSVKKAIIEDLADALNKDKNPYVRAASAWALSRYNDSHNALIGTSRDVRIESLAAAINDEEWFVRYYVALSLATSDDPRAIQPILNLLEHETNPYVIAASAEAAIKLNSLGAVLPVIKTLEKLRFDVSEDEMLYSLDLEVAAGISDGLVSLAARNAQSRQQVIINFMTALQHVQARQDLSDKYEIINYNYLPVFKRLAENLKITRAEIEPGMDNCDQRIRQALFNIIEPMNIEQTAPLPAMEEAEAQYLAAIDKIPGDNPVMANEILRFVESRDAASLSRILLFDRNSSSRRVLAADGLYKIGDNAAMRALIAALGDSHPLVKAAAARSLRNIIAARQFVYTGKHGSIIKAFTDAVNNEDWVVVAYLVDTLRLIGDADALQAISAALASGKHQLISEVVSQSLVYFTAEGSALTQPILKVLSSEADYDVYIQAIRAAKEVLAKTGDPLLIDGIVDLIIRAPANPQDYSRYAILKEGAVKALGQSQVSVERLLSMFRQKVERNDYASANQILSLLQGLMDPQAFRELSASLSDSRSLGVKKAAGDSAVVADASAYTDVSSYTLVIFNAREDIGTRIAAIDKMGRDLSGSGNITATEQLLALIDSEPNADIIGHAISAVVRINDNGMGIIARSGGNPMVKTFAGIAASNKPHAIRKLAIEALGKSLSAEAVEPVAGLLENLRDPLLVKAAIDAANELSVSINNSDIFDALVAGLAKIAGSRRSYENRQQAIEAIGRVNSVAAAEALAEILHGLDEPSLILAAVNAAAESFKKNPDNSIIDALAGVFIDKLDFGPDALKINPGISRAQRMILNTLCGNKGYTLQLLNRLLKDELSRSFKEQDPDRVDNIRYLMSLVKTRKSTARIDQVNERDSHGGAAQRETGSNGFQFASGGDTVAGSAQVSIDSAGLGIDPLGKVVQVSHEQEGRGQDGGYFISKDSVLVKVVKTLDPGPGPEKQIVRQGEPDKAALQTVKSSGNNGSRFAALYAAIPPAGDISENKGIPQAIMGEMREWISANASAHPRVQALLRLAGSGEDIYINPFELRAVREDLKSPDENIRIAAAYLYSKIDHGSIYHVPGTNIDVELLGSGLNSGEIGFSERLFKIIALGRSGDPLASRVLLTAYYKAQEIYPVVEGQGSVKEHERSVLSKAAEWAIANLGPEAVDELRATLNVRFNQGILNYHDIIPVSILERIAPAEFKKFSDRIHLSPSAQSPGSLVSRYAKGGHFYQLNDNMERKSLAFQWDSYNRILNGKQWQDFGLPADFDTVAATLVSNSHSDCQLPIAAAVKLGEIKDPRAVWALNAGLHDDDEFVVAASAWSLGQFESPVNEQDVRIPFFKEALDKHTHPSIRSGIAFALGTSGDPRAVELLNGLLSEEENPMVKIFAANSAKRLASKFKNSTLIRGILALARQDYSYDPLTILGYGENFGPVGQAAFDAVNEIGSQPELRQILVKALRDAVTDELKQETKNIQLINDVYGGLLKKFGPQDYAGISDMMLMIKAQYWLPIAAAALGGILAIGGIFMLIYSKIFRGKPKLLADIDSDHVGPAGGSGPPDPVDDRDDAPAGLPGGLGRDQAVFSAEHDPPPSNANIVPKFKAITREWEILLAHDHLSEGDVSQILQSAYILINLVPFSLAQNGNDLEARASQIDTVISLLRATLDKLTGAVERGDYRQDKKIVAYALECVEICRYFSDYRLALGYVEDLHLSANYRPTREKRALWRKIWGIEAIAVSARENLAYLLGKMYIRGNMIVPYLYQIPVDDNGYKTLVSNYYEKLKPSKLGIARLWQIRKEMTRLMPLYFGIGFGAFTAITGFSALIGSFTMGQVLWYLFRVFTSSFMGVGISTYFSWQFIKRGWDEESEAFKNLHIQLDDYEKALGVHRRTGNPALARQQMLEEEINKIAAGLSAEMDPAHEASADAILFMTGTDPGRSSLIRDQLSWLVRPDVPVFAVSNDIDSRGRLLHGSSASFVKAYSYLNYSSTFGDFLDELRRDKNSVCLNSKEPVLSPKHLRKPVRDARIIIVNVDTPHTDWLVMPALGDKIRYAGRQLNSMQVALSNGYRITQMLKGQGRQGFVHFNADGTYLGPVKEFKDEFTVFASWASQEQMARQALGLLMPNNQSYISKYYDNFEIAKISNWLEREMIGGRFDLKNTKKRQMVISTGILVVSFEEASRFSGYLEMLGRIRAYLVSEGTPGNLPIRSFQDIVIPLIMLSQGENIYTYLEARLKKLAEENEFAAGHKDGLREFYGKMYKIIEESFPTGRPFIFPAHVPYPHESVYSRGSAADLAATLTQYNLIPGLPEGARAGYHGSSSSAIGGPPPVELPGPGGGIPGGIDFRNLGIALKGPPAANPLFKDAGGQMPDEEWLQINRLINARIVPSLGRIVDYLETGSQGLSAEERINNVRAAVTDILRMEEENCLAGNGGFKELMDLVEKDTNSPEVKTMLAKLAEKQ